jgi:hypothetical protein
LFIGSNASGSVPGGKLLISRIILLERRGGGRSREASGRFERRELSCVLTCPQNWLFTKTAHWDVSLRSALFGSSQKKEQKNRTDLYLETIVDIRSGPLQISDHEAYVLFAVKIKKLTLPIRFSCNPQFIIQPGIVFGNATIRKLEQI